MSASKLVRPGLGRGWLLSWGGQAAVAGWLAGGASAAMGELFRCERVAEQGMYRLAVVTQLLRADQLTAYRAATEQPLRPLSPRRRTRYGTGLASLVDNPDPVQSLGVVGQPGVDRRAGVRTAVGWPGRAGRVTALPL